MRTRWPPSDLNTVNDYVVTGVADGASGPARLTVHVLVNPNDAQEPEPGPRAPSRNRWKVGFEGPGLRAECQR